MKKLNREEVLKLKDGDVRTIKLTLLGEVGGEEHNVVSFHKTGTIYAQFDDKGQMCVLTTKSAMWAEYDPRRLGDLDDDGTLMCEEYMMEIFES